MRRLTTLAFEPAEKRELHFGTNRGKPREVGENPSPLFGQASGRLILYKRSSSVIIHMSTATKLALAMEIAVSLIRGCPAMGFMKNVSHCSDGGERAFSKFSHLRNPLACKCRVNNEGCQEGGEGRLVKQHELASSFFSFVACDTIAASVSTVNGTPATLRYSRDAEFETLFHADGTSCKSRLRISSAICIGDSFQLAANASRFDDIENRGRASFSDLGTSKFDTPIMCNWVFCVESRCWTPSDSGTCSKAPSPVLSERRRV